MGDTSAAARQANDPETVLPYDPDDWERRLAEARKRREAVLRREADTIRAAAPDTTPDHVAAVAARPRDAGPGPARPVRADAEDWRRRLAEARGLSAPGDRASDRAVPHARSGHAPAAAPAAAVPTGGASGPAPLLRPRANRRPDLDTARRDDVDPFAGSNARLARRRPVLAMVGAAAFGGLVAGAALTLTLQGTPPEDMPLTRVAAENGAAPLPAGPAPVAIAGAALGRPPAAPPTGFLAGWRTGAHPVAINAVPDLPSEPAGAVAPDALPPPVAPASLPGPAPLPRPTTMAASDAVSDMPETLPGAASAAPYVVVHVPGARAGRVDARLLSDGAAQGWPVVPVDFTVSRSHIRVYHDRDRAAATALGARLDLPVRDFVGAVPAPVGLIEVWIAGGPVRGG